MGEQAQVRIPRHRRSVPMEQKTLLVRCDGATVQG